MSCLSVCQESRGVPEHVLSDLVSLLQYHVATLMNNEINGIPPAQQRGGKAIKSLRQRLVGKETKRELRLEDHVRSRIVTISLNEVSPRESKIGLTMRQPGLGKLEWIAEDHVTAEAAS